MDLSGIFKMDLSGIIKRLFAPRCLAGCMSPNSSNRNDEINKWQNKCNVMYKLCTNQYKQETVYVNRNNKINQGSRISLNEKN